MRADCRVVNCERTNLGTLGRHVVPEPVGVVTIDLSYLALVDALPQLRQELLAPHAHLLALVKPTYELRAGVLAVHRGAVASAVTVVRRAMEGLGWSVEAEVPSAIRGSAPAWSRSSSTASEPPPCDRVQRTDAGWECDLLRSVKSSARIRFRRSPRWTQ